MICLVLADPYDYTSLVEEAVSTAQAAESDLLVVFFVSPVCLRRTIEKLGEKGWLGTGSRWQLEDSMLAGYRALAKDVLKALVERAAAAGVRTRARAYEGDRVGLFRILKTEDYSKVLTDAHVGKLPYSAT